MKTTQKGFSIIEILVVIVAIGIIGAAGWLVYDRQKDEPDSQQAKTQTSQQAQKQEEKTQENNSETQQNTDTSQTNEESNTALVSNARFSVSLPDDWGYRTCSDHEGVGALAVVGESIDCILDDAAWLKTDMASTGKVAVGYGVSSYPRQDFSDGQQKDVYETDAEELSLSDGRTVKKYVYSSEETGTKGKTFKVIEYTLEDKITVFIFDGHSSEADYVNTLSTEDVIKIVEETVLPSIKLL